jgi:hypothetical protein
MLSVTMLLSHYYIVYSYPTVLSLEDRDTALLNECFVCEISTRACLPLVAESLRTAFGVLHSFVLMTRLNEVMKTTMKLEAKMMMMREVKTMMSMLKMKMMMKSQQLAFAFLHCSSG